MNVALAARENCEVVRMTCYDYSYLVGTTRELLEVSGELARFAGSFTRAGGVHKTTCDWCRKCCELVASGQRNQIQSCFCQLNVSCTRTTKNHFR